MTTTTTTTFIQFHSPYSSLSLSPDHDHSCSTSEDVNVMLASKHPKKPAGRKKFRETRHPVYRGVRRRDSGNWVCEVREPNKKSRVWLGTYPTADMAARAHDVAVLAMRGPSACLNFADSLWRLPVPKSGNVKDIQKAAVKAAEAFRQAEESEENNEVLKNVFYIDEEAILGMPGFLADMAEGMMLPPPRMVGYDTCHADLEYSIDVSLWSF